MKKSLAVKKLERGQDLRSLSWFRKHRYVKLNKKKNMLVLTRKGVGLLKHFEG